MDLALWDYLLDHSFRGPCQGNATREADNLTAIVLSFKAFDNPLAYDNCTK